MRDDRQVALEIVKAWFRDMDAAFLAKEDVVVHWESFNDSTKKGEWIKERPGAVARIIKSTRANLNLMRYVTIDLVRTAAQELERMYVQGVNTKGVAPKEYFNYNRTESYTRDELLVACVLKALVGKGWNTEIKDLHSIVVMAQAKINMEPISNQKLNKAVRVVGQESGMILRDRKDRLFINGVGRFCAVQIEGLKTIKLDYSNEDKNLVAKIAANNFLAITEPEFYSPSS
ncbi:hypothetical protein I6H07_06270 [Hafnia alvei]|uniref:hypothetical protein n=1 Tax=Hafnia alvei TaxID=569 RepID=UPI000B73F5A6|nr:hypothetical protein [Hafnia alvei]MBI0275439.1 hypothetical protein [Hafnia alvei]PNK98566.1 hypothetical protein CEQ28_013715 [Hafnia alvei]